jgi:hypothetical protein
VSASGVVGCRALVAGMGAGRCAVACVSERAVRPERLRGSRDRAWRYGPLLIVPSRVAPHAAAAGSPADRPMGPAYSGRVASDQHRPASSRAMA